MDLVKKKLGQIPEKCKTNIKTIVMKKFMANKLS